MGIQLSVVLIPLFWVDIPSSSQHIGFSPELTRSEPDNHVEVAQIFRPSDLASRQHFRGREVFQVLVIGDDVDRKLRTFEVMSPLRKGVEDR